jgi:hypothetical protein
VDDIGELGGEITEVVVDINQVDVLGFTGATHQIGQRLDDLVDIAYQFFGVQMR